MCGRSSLKADPALVAEFTYKLGADLPDWYRPRYNISPGDQQLVVMKGPGERIIVDRKWGFVPAKNPNVAKPYINAKAETIDTLFSFKDAFRLRRALVMADRFYEWRKNADGSKTPFRIHLPGQALFVMAAIWEHAVRKGKPVDSCAIITCAAQGIMVPLHDRMPVILPLDAVDEWLDPSTSVSHAKEIMAANRTDLEVREITSYVNSTKNEGPLCGAPAEIGS